MSYFHHLYIPLPSLLNNSKRIWMRWLARVRKSVEGHGTNIIFSVFKSKLSYREMYPGTFPPSPLNKLRFSLYLSCSMRYYTALWEWQTFLCIYTVPGPMLEARDSSRSVEKPLFLGNSEESWIRVCFSSSLFRPVGSQYHFLKYCDGLESTSFLGPLWIPLCSST